MREKPIKFLISMPERVGILVSLNNSDKVNKLRGKVNVIENDTNK
jgi:hypothetical protein